MIFNVSINIRQIFLMFLHEATTRFPIDYRTPPLIGRTVPPTTSCYPIKVRCRIKRRLPLFDAF